MTIRPSVHARNAVAATSQPLASETAIAILKDGGNAIDAAVAAAAVLGVVEPHMTGLGGDMFALLWSAAERRLVGLNASGPAGAGMTRAELVRRGYREMPAEGAETVTVPGGPGGWAALLERFGTMSLAQVLEPAIGFAEGGFAVTPVIALEWGAHGPPLADPAARATYLLEGGRAPAAGERFRTPDLATSLRLIAAEGPGALYGGELGACIADHVAERGGFLAPADFARYRPEWVAPISVPYGGVRLWELPPNGQGIAALEMLRILEGFDLRAMGHNSPAYLHHLIEAKKLAFADIERHLADPAFMTGPPERLLSARFIADRRARLDPALAAAETPSGFLPSETVYLTTADSQGNMVSFINSIFNCFGSGVVVPGTGFALQNRGSGFSLEAGHPNMVAPGKRPRHTIIPAFVTRSAAAGEEPWLSFGVMGGPMQPQGHVQVLLNMLLFGMDPQQAIDAPRFRHLAGRQVLLEREISNPTLERLNAMGHEAEYPPPGPQMFGGGQAITRSGDGYTAGSDSRKDGVALGY